MPQKIRTVIIAAAMVVGVAGCAGTNNVDTSVSGSGGFQFAVASGAVKVISPAQRRMADEVTGTTLQGAPFSLASYRGKYAVVNFWSAACGPCRGEEPGFEALSKADTSKGVAFVGIDERDNRADALAFEAHFGVTYPSLFDRNDSYTLDFPGAVPSTTPFTIVLDPQGRIAAWTSALLDYGTLRKLVDTVRSDST